MEQGVAAGGRTKHGSGRRPREGLRPEAKVGFRTAAKGRLRTAAKGRLRTEAKVWFRTATQTRGRTAMAGLHSCAWLHRSKSIHDHIPFYFPPTNSYSIVNNFPIPLYHVS